MQQGDVHTCTEAMPGRTEARAARHSPAKEAQAPTREEEATTSAMGLSNKIPRTICSTNVEHESDDQRQVVVMPLQ